ncbi:MAG TPA: hypothetical protein VNR36_00735 [Pseudolysinimonas sp.]|nr:hypothetical protein [Pseudolysinimonas sp.]
MSAESGLVAGSRPAVTAPPELSGWAGAATAIHAIQQMTTPMVLNLDIEGHAITIDFAYNAFAGDLPLADLPAYPRTVLVETRTQDLDAAPEIELPGRSLDSLLWLIGYHAFGDEPAPWLVEGHRYRLRRWPSLGELSLSLDQVRMTAMLGNAFATSAELAAAAHTPPADARRLVNGFSTVGILRRSAGAPPLVEAVPDAGEPHPATGLFSRLREKWGR